MNFKISYNGKVKRPKITLHTPDLKGIGMLKTSDKLNFELNANNISSFEFNIYKKINGKDNPYYDLVEKGNLIQAESLGVYWIVDVDLYNDGLIEYKEVKCKSLEYELTRRKIFDINGVYYLYNITKPDKSLLHVITEQLGNWSIGHVDNELIGLARTFKIDSIDAYSLLTEEISLSFEAIFQFDHYNRTISAYTIENFGKRVNLVLSYNNLVKENLISASLDKIITCFKVRGGGDLDIRAVNPTLSDKIYNYSYFMVKKSEGGKISDELVDVWSTYQIKYNNLKSVQESNLVQLKSLQAQLLELQNKAPSSDTNDWTQYGLVELKSKKSSYDVVLAALLSNGAGDPSSSQYSEYVQNKNIVSAIEAEIKVRENQIKNVQLQIENLNDSIVDIASQLSFENNFTTEQIKELMNITFEDEYVDDTYVVAETDSEETKLEVKQQLYDVANNVLMRVSQPQYTIDTKLVNLLLLPEFKNYQGDFWLGNIISIKVNKNFIATARLLSIRIDFEKPEDISVVFANRNKLDDDTIDFQKIQEQATKASTSVSVSGQKWDEAAKYSYEFNKYKSEALNLATQELWNADNQEVTMGAYGIRCKEYNPILGDYEPEQLWIVKNKIVFSDDGFNSAKTVFGKYIFNGVTYYGLLGEAIVGNLFIGEKLRLTGSGAELDLSANESILGLSASITANINGLRTEFNQTLNNYSTTDEISSLINQFGDSLLDDISSNYATKIELSSSISQSASEILTAVSANYATNTSVNNLTTRVSSAESSISQLATEITTKVSATNYNGETIVSMINQSSSKISMSALNIDLSGYVTFSSLSTPGATVIDGGNITAGTITGITINGTNINGSTIFGGSITSSDWTGNQYGIYFDEIIISGGQLKCSRTFYPNSNYGDRVMTINSTLNSSGLTINNVYANNIGASNNLVSNAYFNQIYASKIGASGNAVNTGYFTSGYFSNLYLNGVAIQIRDQYDIKRVYNSNNTTYLSIDGNDIVCSSSNASIGKSNSIFSYGYFYNLYIGSTSYGNYTRIDISRQEIRPGYKPSGQSYYLGTSSYAWDYGYINNINANTLNSDTINAATLYVGNSTRKIYMDYQELRPTVSSTSYSYYLGTSSFPWSYGYFRNLYVDNLPVMSNRVYANTSYYLNLNTSYELVPNRADFSLGNSGNYFGYLFITRIYHGSGGTLGFYGKTPISRPTVSKLSSGATNTEIINKINSLLDALGNSTGLGLIGL